jgi:hypothetical protein
MRMPPRPWGGFHTPTAPDDQISRLATALRDTWHVEQLLRHADIKTTVGTYGHFDIENSREALKSMPAAHDLDSDRDRATLSDSPDVPSLFQAVANDQETKAPAQRTSPEPGAWIGAEHRVRTGDLRLSEALPGILQPPMQQVMPMREIETFTFSRPTRSHHSVRGRRETAFCNSTLTHRTISTRVVAIGTVLIRSHHKLITRCRWFASTSRRGGLTRWLSNAAGLLTQD